MISVIGKCRFKSDLPALKILMIRTAILLFEAAAGAPFGIPELLATL